MSGLTYLERLQSWRKRVQAWATSGAIRNAIEQVVGLTSHQPILDALIAAWAEESFEELPDPQILEAAAMPGLARASVGQNSRIYVNAAWLNSAQDDKVLAVLTSKLGNHLVSLLDQDATGEAQGERFAVELLPAEKGSDQTQPCPSRAKPVRS